MTGVCELCLEPGSTLAAVGGEQICENCLDSLDRAECPNCGAVHPGLISRDEMHCCYDCHAEGFGSGFDPALLDLIGGLDRPV